MVYKVTEEQLSLTVVQEGFSDWVNPSRDLSSGREEAMKKWGGGWGGIQHEGTVNARALK